MDYLIFIPYILALSIFFQLVALLFFTRLISLTREYTSLIFIGAVISVMILMIVNRSILFYDSVTSISLNHQDIKTDLITLLISLVMAMSVYYIKPFFLAIKNTKKDLQKTNNLLKMEVIKRKKNEDQLALMLREKEVLLTEIHHRVKNNLQVITSMLGLQLMSIDDDETKKLFRDSQARINTIALVHEMLYSSENFSAINYGDYLKQLLPTLINSMNKNDLDIKLNITTANISLNLNTSIPLGLIINEIISNCLKHAFNKEEVCMVMVNLKEIKYPDFELTIGDNGAGFSDDTPPSKPNSLGIKIMDALARQLQGAVKKDLTKKGTHYVINFKEIQK